MLSEEQKKIIAADQLKKQPVQTVSAAFFLQLFEACANVNQGNIPAGNTTEASMPLEVDGQKYMAHARVTFKPF